MPLRSCPFPFFRACRWSRTDLNPGHQKHPVPLTTVMVARFLTLFEPLDSVVPGGPFYFHLGLFVLDFLQPKDPCQMYHLYNAVWASSGLAQTAIPTSSLDSWSVCLPLHPNPKGSLLLIMTSVILQNKVKVLNSAFKAFHHPVLLYPSPCQPH